jgi:AcrR family transcriptional regulator
MDSREKLLAAALHLFAARGVDRVSVRDIAHEAGVNSALVGYYFRSKDGLLSQLYRRHCEPLNAERIRLLGSYGRGGAGPSLEKVLEAFIRPALASPPTATAFRSLRGCGPCWPPRTPRLWMRW